MKTTLPILAAIVAGLAVSASAAPKTPPDTKAVATPIADGKTLWQPYRITPRAGAEHIALDGDWQLGWRDAAIQDATELKTVNNWFSAQVPGTVQWALHRAGQLPHPYEHLNSKQYDWVDEKVWYYRRDFNLPASPGERYVFLCFDGIDYFARVWLNGKLLGRHEGMFGGPDIEVSKLARFGATNELVVEVRAGNFGNKAGWKPQGPAGPVIKPWVIAGGIGAEMFFPLGMWRGARVEIVPLGHIERPLLVTESASAREASLSLSCEVFAGAHSLELDLHPWKATQLQGMRDAWTSRPSKSRFALRVRMLDKGSNHAAVERTFPLQTFAGRNFFKETFTLTKPKLWWPNGMGEPHLYRVQLALIREGNAEDAIEFDYGVRTIATVPTAGPRTTDRWADWQFVVNGRPLFVKGINWMPADILLDLPRERYRWLLGAAKAAGMQMLRIWGGGLLETEEFYATCNELGLMVWQDFPIGNRDTPDWPQDVWEAQVMQTIFRLRNHPSLALWCGGNEFNPYSLGNAASIGIWERCLADFDPTRPMRRTSPDAGSIHTYPDMDPTWYGHLYNLMPFVSETGMHSIPDPQSIREVVAAGELEKPLSGMFEKSFPKEHPDLMQHFVEYQPSRVPRMLSRASHIDNMSAPMLEALSEGTQIGAGEFYQILSDQTQANYPVTSGLLPWVFKRPWPVIAIMLVDGFGQPTAPYYFLKRTYEPTHILVKLPHLMWAKGEELPVVLQVVHAPAEARKNLKASVAICDATFAERWRQQQRVSVPPGPSVTPAGEWKFSIPAAFEDTFFFVVAELRDSAGKLVSRSVYWPPCLSQMNDDAFRAKYRSSPQPTLTFDKGPWLKPQAARQSTSLELSIVSRKELSTDRSRFHVRVRNRGSKPAFMTRLDVLGAKRLVRASDNFFWLPPGEEIPVELEVFWRDPAQRDRATLSVSAWNAPLQQLRPPQ